jgi:hypothetical protein
MIEKDKPRTFMTPAYIREIEPGLYEMFRDVEIEENGKREKFGKSIGPIMVLRPMTLQEKNEKQKPDFITSTPGGDILELKRIDDRRPEAYDILDGMVK